MTAITFDTLKFVQTLQESGFDQKQAEAVSRAFKEAQGEAGLATKSDIGELKAEMRELKSEIRELELRMTIKLGGMMAAAVVITGALVKLL